MLMCMMLCIAKKHERAILLFFFSRQEKTPQNYILFTRIDSMHIDPLHLSQYTVNNQSIQY